MPIIKEFKEYEEILETNLNNCDLDKLQCYLKRNKLDKALKITRHSIKAKSWVGVIKFKNTHIQILPKLICNDENNKENILKNLIYMLSYTKKLDIKTSDNSKLSKEKNPFIEILIREYAKSLFDCLKRFTPKKYVREEDNLNYLRGKIRFNENIRYNSVNHAKFYCKFDEFEENNLLNQLFLFVSTCLYNISSNSENKKILKLITNYYSDIKLVRFNKFMAEKIKLPRNQELFRKPFNLAKMFVEKTSVDLSKNKFENITLVWDMNILFEEFIFEFIKKNIKGCSITAQKGKRLLKKNQETRRDTKVDIFLKNPNIIIDTKYKKFVSFDDVSNTDIYQVATYCLLHNYHKAILLYPQFDNNEPDTKGFKINNDTNDYCIDFCTIDLKYDDLRNNNVQKKITRKLKEILFSTLNA